MNKFTRAFSILLLTVACASANTIVSYAVAPVSGNTYRYSYFFSGLALTANQEVDIAFDPVHYANLRNASAGPAFDLALFQPNKPVGSTGFYSILALVNNPTTLGSFTVDFDYLGPGAPGSQSFTIYDDNFSPLLLVDSGQTTPLVTAVPEPSSLFLSLSSLLCALGLIAHFRRKRSQA